MSSYTEGQIHQLAEALQKGGFTGDDLTRLGQSPQLSIIRAVLRGELMIPDMTRKWWEKDGVIYFSVTSVGTTGKEWIKRLESRLSRIGDYTKSVLLSNDFKPTNGVTYQIAVLKGTLFKDNKRITSNICVNAQKGRLTKPNAEVACLIWGMFSYNDVEAMGLISIVAMHEPINDSDGDPNLLYVHRNGVLRLDTGCTRHDSGWSREVGFAFVSQVVSPQN